MGFIDKIFGAIIGDKKSTQISLRSPINGTLMDASEIPDPTFAECILGPTIGFQPGEDCTVYAPCDGVITQIFKTAHALTITSNDKVEILVHVGINTVDLKGEGFEALVAEDAEVKAGQPLIKFNREVIAKAGLSEVVPMVICNAADFNTCNFIDPQDVTAETEICSLEPKI